MTNSNALIACEMEDGIHNQEMQESLTALQQFKNINMIICGVAHEPHLQCKLFRNRSWFGSCSAETTSASNSSNLKSDISAK